MLRRTPQASSTRRRLLGVSLALLVTSLVACSPPQPALVSAPATTPVREFRASGSGAVLPLIAKLAEIYAPQAPTMRIVTEPGTNTGGAITGVYQGTLDLAAASRPLSEAEALQPLVYHALVRDAMAFAARRPNVVENLTVAQIRDIYAGDMKSWVRVGGADAPIIAIDRDADESLRKLVFLPLMAGRPVQAGIITMNSTGDMVSAIAETPGSIGYAPLGYLSMNQHDALRIFHVDGVKPGVEAIEDGSYPWHLVLGLVVHREAPAELRQFVDFSVRNAPSLLREFGYAAP